ncbi:MAG: flagellar biosynthetic protein FliP [Candidatus Dadabacteria bacterium]|nr:MAG: flagellar biosynthetic protein FliP [Candidatus Dadabacteria bacterium]
MEGRRGRKETRYCLILLFLIFALGTTVYAQDTPLPDVSITIGKTTFSSDGSISSALKLILLVSAITFAPAAVLTMTSFTRIAVVLSLTRTVLGTAQMPPNMVIIGLSLFLTFAIMNPVFSKMYSGGIYPYMEGQMGGEEAYRKGSKPLKEFLVAHSRDKDIELFLEITKTEAPEELKDVPFYVAVPAFVVSELNTAFQIGFLIALPFLILDMVVSSVLTSMSMITLPPVVISLPLKLMLFVLVDGWHLIIASLVETYHI